MRYKLTAQERLERLARRETARQAADETIDRPAGVASVTARRLFGALLGIPAAYVTLVAVAVGVGIIQAERKLQKRGL